MVLQSVLYKKIILKHEKLFYGVVNISNGGCVIMKTKHINRAILTDEKDLQNILSVLKVKKIEPEIINVVVDEFYKIIPELSQIP